MSVCTLCGRAIVGRLGTDESAAHLVCRMKRNEDDALRDEGAANERARIRAVIGKVLSDNGCDCECDHHQDEHDDDCERCLGCRIAAALDAMKEK